MSARIIKAPILFAPLIIMSEVNVRYLAAIVVLFWFNRFHSYLSFESGLMLVGDQGQGRLLLGWRRSQFHSLALAFLQNHCIDGERCGWSWSQPSWSALELVAAVAT